MAAPIIRGLIPPGPLVFAPGESKQIKVDAFDPDAGTPVSFTFHARDQGGNDAVITLSASVSDPITYSADLPPAGWAVSQNAADPSVFTVRAP